MSLSQKVVSAVGWSAGLKIGFQLVTWAMTLLVIRILSPADYGLMAITQIFINVMAGMTNVGLADALVQREDTPKPLVASVFGLMLVVSLALVVGLCLAAYPIASWYNDSRLVPLIQVSSLGFLFSGVTTIPRIFLTKTLRVRPMFLMEMSSGLVSAFTVIYLAYHGYGVWALMDGWLLGGVVRCLGFVVLASEYFVWPSWNFGLCRPLLSYGLYRTFDYLAWAAYVSSDTLIIGWLLGPTNLGFYTVAMNFAGMPLSKIAPIINSVAFPAFALVQSNPSDARFYAVKAMRMMATIAVPIFFGISAVAPEIVHFVFGPKWDAAEPMLAILSLAVTFRAILVVLPNFLQGIGAANAGFWCTAAGLILFPPAFVIGCHWGIIGACYAWLLGYPVMYAINAAIAARAGGLDFRELMLLPLQPLIAGIAMVAAVMAIRAALPPDVPRILAAILFTAAGAAVYVGVLAAAFRPLLREIAQLFGRRGPSVEATAAQP